ncbi:hypothetical protein ACG98H_04625 [Corynebacterium sp. L4756]|uniref:hypothetical protein n=1 Tax=unclassified Corynebacterium TaxID=2624378 RepID=UPI00374CCCE1
MAKHTTTHRIEARLRLITASEFHAHIHDEAFRKDFLGDYEWAASTPVIPALWSSTVEEVCEQIECMCTDEDQYVVVPVLLREPIRLACILVTDLFDVFEPEMCMDEVCEALALTSDWAFAKEQEVRVQKAQEIQSLVDLV